MCAIEAGKRGRRIVVLDHAERAGKKILISGGGRCNFTNLHTRAENYISANPHFAKSALARYTPQDFLALVNRHGIAWHEKTLGQLFCDRSATDILNLLLAECAAAHVRVACGTHIDRVERNGESFTVTTNRGEWQASSLVIATGGLSIPKMGATGFGYEIARQFGLKIVEPRAALVPLVFSQKDLDRWGALAGVSTEVTAAGEAKKAPAFREKLLFTHRGLSGPAVLQASSYWRPGEAVRIDLAPGAQVSTPVIAGARRDAATLKAALNEVLPARLASAWIEAAPPKGWSNAALEEWERGLHAWRVVPDGTEGYAKAEVTAGGVDTAELSASTMEAKRVPGLFFIGEVVDVTGHLGGFNFQWAWASGVAAGQVA
ncbi:NAD(P)/FAD-dependent oxidoreductase [Silvibacterium dinghuense]|uniref:NAD(P)/FAD-dependent oxidoreductase n=2 Tax=Silvibacterium dinghuense TaxID=1560006 RepID=A0A4Q1SKZ0_9BACT|nr:NAD(P)/FAD-dependent oxidoreductase [Silvibacterium dinghuense]